jgi:hypothetical protein
MWKQFLSYQSPTRRGRRGHLGLLPHLVLASSRGKGRFDMEGATTLAINYCYYDTLKDTWLQYIELTGKVGGYTKWRAAKRIEPSRKIVPVSNLVSLETQRWGSVTISGVLQCELLSDRKSSETPKSFDVRSRSSTSLQEFHMTRASSCETPLLTRPLNWPKKCDRDPMNPKISQTTVSCDPAKQRPLFTYGVYHRFRRFSLLLIFFLFAFAEFISWNSRIRSPSSP